MKLYAVLPILVFCLAFPAYAPGTQDTTTVSQDENLNTVAEREQALTSLLTSAREVEGTDLLKAVQLRNRAGRLQLKLNRPEEALATFQDNLKLTDQLNDSVAKVDALNGAAAALLHSSNYLDAIPLLKQAITIAEQNNYLQGRAESLLSLSDAQNNTNHGEALKTAQDALPLWQSVGNPRGIIRSYLAIGTFQLALNNLDQAIQSDETALSLARQNGFKDLEADALIGLGFVEYRKFAWQNVTRFLVDAEKLIDPEAEPFKMTQITAMAGEAYIESGLPEAGLPKYVEALEYIKKTKQPRDEIVVKWSIGRIQYLLKKYPEALATLQEVLADAESLQNPVVQAMSHEFLGRTYQGIGDSVSALQHLETANTLYAQVVNPMEVARTRALIGQVYETTGKLPQAKQSYEQALQTFDKLSDRVNQSATLFALGRLEMKTGDYQNAETHLRQSIEVTENLRRPSSSRDLTAAFSATVHDRYEQYIQCLMRNHRDPQMLSQVIQAFETSESARARSLAELLRVSNTNLSANMDPELAKQESSLGQSLRMKEDERVSLLKNKYEKQDLEKLDAELEQLNEQYRNVLATINARYPAFEQLTQPRSWDLRRIQEEVIGDDDTVLLEFLLGSDKSYAWAVTRRSITSYELPASDAITEAVKKVYELVKGPGKPETRNTLDQATQELAAKILWPLADQLNKKRVIVAPDGALNYIPFQLLPVGASNPEPLVAEHEIINAPSASILGDLRKEAARRGVRAKALAAFGDPRFPQDEQQQTAATRNIEINIDVPDLSVVGRLFYSAREIANLLDVVSKGQAFAATEYDATRDQLLSLDLTQFAILHLATHGLLDPKHPERSGLLLSTVDREGKKLNGFIGLQDVYSLRAPVDLVVLSACQTGLGENIRGEGLIGLTRGFMYAGATSVVASLWQVEDEATAELMKRFYTEMLKNGKTPAEALRSAQNSIRQIPEWSAPHYWAGFTLQGEYHYVVNSERGGWRKYSVVIVIGSVLILLVGVWVYWSRFHSRKTTQH